MCLTIPGRILRIDPAAPDGPRATLDFAGIERSASLLFLPEAKVGEYVIVQSGFAMTRMDEAEALEAWEYTKQLHASRSEAQGVPAASTESSGTGGPA